MSDLTKLTQEILDQMPPETRFSAADAAQITQHRTLLLGLEDTLVAGFYNTLFSHTTTKQIFTEGERPAREQTLRQWWQRTINGTFDDEYWTWQTLVGLIHVKRKVKNPMMMGMWGWMLTAVREHLTAELPAAELGALMGSLEKLAATTQSLTAESYLVHYMEALQEATGFKPELLDRMVAGQVDDLLAAVRGR